jgi:Raf kinase inhibitor-like YbhB/YbcL family protein
VPANPIGVLLRSRRAGEGSLAWALPALAAPSTIELTSPAFEHGARLPDRFRGRLRGPHVSPALAWTPPPEGVVELALVIQDPDVPFRTAARHGMTVGIDPALEGIPEGGLRDPSPVDGLVHGRGTLGRSGYLAPMPIRSHGAHAYVFQLFALDRPSGLSAGFSLDDLVAAMTGHLLARARLDGTFEIP